MKISKTKFFEYVRCNRYPALEEITYQRDKAVISFDESLEDLYTQEIKLKKKELLESLYENLDYSEQDFEEDQEFDPLSDDESTKLINLLQPQYDLIEEMSAKKVKTLFDGQVIHEKDTFRQKYIQTEMDGFVFFAFLDTFQEDEKVVRIIETKASTSNKFYKLGYKDKGEHISIFKEQENGILKLKQELQIDVNEEKYQKNIQKMFNKYDDVGKYVYDLAYQRYVLENSKQTSKELEYYLAVLNRNFVFNGQLDKDSKPIYDPNEIMTLIDLTSVTGMLQPIIKEEIKTIINRLNTMQAQPVPIGKHCQKDKAHRECPFLSVCLKDKHVPEKNSLFVYRNSHHGFTENRAVKNSPKHDIYDLINEGMTESLDIPREWLSKKQQIQYDVINTKIPHIEKDMIKKGIEKLKYPLYHLDFESFASPLPRYKGEKPYQQSLFQFSLHIEHKHQMIDKNDNISFLADDHKDHREELVKKLIDAIPMDNGNVIVYNKGFESGRISELIELFPQYEKHLSDIKRRIFDLLYLVRGNEDFYKDLDFDKDRIDTLVFYDESLQRSYSIKQVLPIFVPELDYKKLKEVQNGQQAQIAYFLIPYQTESERLKTYYNMLEYCKQDTWAMVKILSKLRKIE